MRIFILTALLFISTLSFSQKCNPLKNEYNELNGKTTMLSPFTLINMACSMNVYRVINHNNNYDSTFICLKIGTTGRQYDPKGILIRFENGKTIKDPVFSAFSDYDHGYYCATCYPISNEDQKDFENQKIVKIQIDQFAVDVKDKYAKDFIRNLACLYSTSIKKPISR